MWGYEGVLLVAVRLRLGRVSFFSSQVLCIESLPNGVAWLLTTVSRIASRHGLALRIQHEHSVEGVIGSTDCEVLRGIFLCTFQC